jgi:hypothetical protein
MVTFESQAPGPFFAVGIWRSGTSLLHALLNQHPQIALLYEGDLPLLGAFFRVPGGRKGWAKRWNFWNGALRRHQLEAAVFPKDLSDENRATRAVYRMFAARKGARIWGEKSPTYYVELRRLARSFPDARFLIIWRDPAEILDSMYRAAAGGSLWFRKRGMPLRALMGFREMKRQRDELVRRGILLHEIDYKKMTSDPENVMREVCGFLDIPFDVRMASLADADRSAVPEGEHHAKVKSQAIEHAEKEKSVLPPELKGKVDRYVNLWRKQTGGDWPSVAPRPDPPDSAAMPSWAERTADAVAFRLLRGFDHLVLLLYSIAPISLLQSYRDQKRRAAGLSARPRSQGDVG